MKRLRDSTKRMHAENVNRRMQLPSPVIQGSINRAKKKQIQQLRGIDLRGSDRPMATSKTNMASFLGGQARRRRTSFVQNLRNESSKCICEDLLRDVTRWHAAEVNRIENGGRFHWQLRLLQSSMRPMYRTRIFVQHYCFR